MSPTADPVVDQWLKDYPCRRPSPPAGTFEFGLCMAGAISAGAYTAGVLDLFFEALDAFEQAKREGKAPRHRAVLRVLGGASAGGMCAALATVFADLRFPPRTPASNAPNPLHSAWVKEADIRGMLRTDGNEEDPLASLLDCRVLDQIVANRLDERALMLASCRCRRDWLPEDRLPVILTLANLHGIPYAIRFTGSPFSHYMQRHADWIRFALPLEEKVAPKVAEILLDAAFLSQPSNRRAFADAVLATGAFPIVLQARKIARPRADYDLRAALHPGSPLSCTRGAGLDELRPDWPHTRDPIESLYVDGGMLDNEPIELVRRELAGWAGRNPRDGQAANRAVILVDPFVNPPSPCRATDLSLLGQIPVMFGALMSEARFKPEELALAADGENFSRFIIAPSRGPTWQGEGAIAGGFLNGFMGFLHEAYRQHDFLLGRRNARSFLRNHFLLPECNPLFSAWSEEDKQRWGRIRTDARGESRRYLPVIPLCGRLLPDDATEATEEAIEPLPHWPRGCLDKAELAALEAAIRARAETVLRKAWAERADDLVPKLRRKAEQMIENQGWFLRQAGRLLIAFAGRRIATAAERNAISAAAEGFTTLVMTRIRQEIRAIDRL
jgi:hypothetical protein